MTLTPEMVEIRISSFAGSPIAALTGFIEGGYFPRSSSHRLLQRIGCVIFRPDITFTQNIGGLAFMSHFPRYPYRAYRTNVFDISVDDVTKEVDWLYWLHSAFSSLWESNILPHANSASHRARNEYL